MNDSTNSRRAAAAAAVLTLFALPACGPSNQTSAQSSPRPNSNSTPAHGVTSRETPVASEANVPGDIPDSQAFVGYSSPAGYSLKVPEGWARAIRGAEVTFTNKLDGVSVTAPPVPDTPSSIGASARAGSGFKTKAVTLPAGPAVDVAYSSNSEPDQVTGKKVRLANEAVIFRHGALHATLRVWAPLGADNVDQWNAIKRSFRFR